eukprot:TRINITY_DN6927_c0_g1_i2.p1 TRINITY_DN6927_c0_g1~~TRINITY_DN6927_c0_g1_i2.p1  ORF type:complete len:347 (-),score=66.47 TRINITY_DN6927_c0_g1_i2:175-1215(-)
MCIRDRVSTQSTGRASDRRSAHTLEPATSSEDTVMTVSKGATAPPAQTASVPTWLLGVIFAGWYGASMITGTSTKKLLGMSTSPLLITLMQFTLSAVLSRIICAARDTFVPLSFAEYQQFLPVCLSYTFGFLCLNCSLGQGNVSFMETLRACEPLFSLLFVKLFLPQENITPAMYLSVIPIVCGIALSSMSEPSFSTAGFVFATGANLCFASRSLFVKKVKSSSETFRNLDAVSMIHHQHLMALPLLLVLVLMNDGLPSVTSTTFLQYALVNGACFYSYNQLSLVVLYTVTMASHSIGNAFRRVATIVFAILMFGNPVSSLNVLGIALAILGVTFYSRAAALKNGK